MNKVETTLGGVNNDENIAILTGKSENYEYKDGKRLGDSPIGMKYNVVLPGNRLNGLTVKVAGADQLQQISDEQIGEAISSRKFILVRFTNCKVSIYNIDDSMIMSAFAKSVELVKPEGAKTA